MWLVPDIVKSGADRFGDRLAVSDPRGQLTYQELETTTGRLASLLLGLDIGQGERIVVVLPNSIQFVQAHFGALRAGAVSVPCDSAITKDNLRAICQSCQPRVLITDTATLTRFEYGPDELLCDSQRSSSGPYSNRVKVAVSVIRTRG